MSTPALDSVFPVVIVNFGAPGDSTILNTVSDRVTFQCTEGQKQTIRFDARTGKLNVWVTDETEEYPYPFQIQLAHARITELSETDVQFEGVEVDNFTLTGRAAQVILTNATSGWVHD
jgi:hypothetical protein